MTVQLNWENSTGIYALAVLTTGVNNTAVGQNALKQYYRQFNVAVGGGALPRNTTGEYNMAIGTEALKQNITGNFNMGIGFRALFFNTTGGQNTAVGAAALRNNRTLRKIPPLVPMR